MFRSTRTGVSDLYQKLTSGAGVEERMVASGQLRFANSWSADGRILLYRSIDPQTNAELWVVSMARARTPSVFLKTPFGEVYCAFSPNGSWTASLRKSNRSAKRRTSGAIVAI